MRLKILIVLALASTTFYSCKEEDDPQPQPKGDLTVHFDLKWDAMNSVEFNSGDTFTIASGDNIIVNDIRFWASNIKLYNNGAVKWTDKESYYLVEKTSTNEREMVMLSGIPVGTYDKIEFSIGVDSAHNHALDQKEGELDETIGMSWNWTTGYKFYVQDGSYWDTTTSTYQQMEVHMGLDQYYSTVQIDFPMDISLTKNGTHLVHIMVSNGKTFNTPNVINVSERGGTLKALMPDQVFTDIVENYSSMFMIHHVQ